MRELFKYTFLITSFLFLSSFLGAQDRDQSFREAQDAFDQGRFTLAAKLFTEYSLRYPVDSRADDGIFMGAVAHVQSQDYPKAMDALVRLERLFPESPYESKLSYWKGRCEFALENWEESSRFFELQTQKKNEGTLESQSWYYWGTSLYKLGKKAEAYRVWKAVPIQDLWSQRSLMQAGILELELGKAAECVAILSPLTQNFLEPEIQHGALYYLIEAFSALKDYSSLLSGSEKFLEAFPQDSEEPRVRYFRAQAFEALGNLSQAEGEYHLASLSKNPSQVNQARFSLGSLYSRQGKYQESLELWTTVSSSGLSDTQIQMIQSNAGLAAYKLGKWSLAASWYDKCSRGSDPQIASEALLSLASAQFMDKKPGESAKNLETYLITYPQGVKRWDCGDLLLRYYSQTGDSIKAEKILDLLIGEFPQHPSKTAYFLERSRLRTLRKDFTGALTDAQGVMDSNPPKDVLGEALYQAAFIYSERKEPLRGEKYLFRILSEFPRGELYDRTLLARGLAFYNGGRWDEAEGSWNRLLRESPGSDHKASVLQNLGLLKDKQGKFQESLGFYYEAAGLLQGDSQAQALFHAAIQAGKFDSPRALVLWKEAADKHPLSSLIPQIRFQEGLVLASLGNYPEAQKSWDLGLIGASNQLWQEIATQKVMTFIKNGEDPTSLLKIWEKRIPESPGILDGYLLWSDRLIKDGKWSESSRVGRQLDALGPQSPQLESFFTREALAWYEEKPEEGRKKFISYFTRFNSSSGAPGAARSLGALLIQKNLPEELTWWLENIGSYTPLGTVKTELLLTQARVVLDRDWEGGLGILKEIQRGNSSASQKVESLVIGAEAGLRNQKYKEVRNFVQAIPRSADIFQRGRALLASAMASQRLGEGLKALTDLAKEKQYPPEIRAQALYEAYVGLVDKSSAQGRELLALLLGEFPDSSWSTLIKTLKK